MSFKNYLKWVEAEERIHAPVDLRPASEIVRDEEEVKIEEVKPWFLKEKPA